MASKDGSVPPIGMLLRSKKGVHMMKLSSSEAGEPSLVPADVLSEPVEGDITEFSPDGNLVAIVTSQPKDLKVVRVETGEVLWSHEGRSIQALSFSPRGIYLITWERLSKEPTGGGEKGDAGNEGEGEGTKAIKGNLLAWGATSGETIAGFTQKNFRKPDWPTLQWTRDESLCFKCTANEVQVYAGANVGGGAIKKFPLQGLGSIRVTPANAPYRLACFFPEAKGKPASVRIHQYPEFGVALASKSFFKAQEAHLRWSPNGQAVLIHTHTDVDTSGVSYYGSTGLYLVHADGGFEVTVPLPKDGPISAAEWAPTTPAQFIVVAGRMPSGATLYNVKAEPTFEFGQAHRNTVCFSPHGRFVAIAGFGNLAGEIDFWDRNKQKLLGHTTSHCAVGYGWSPCSRYFMTATLAPRMNVDNAVKLFKYNGVGPVYTASFEDASLFDAQFRPADPGVFPDRPATPPRKGEEAQALPPPPAPKPKAAYRPPGSSGAFAAMLRAEREAVSGLKKVGKSAYGGPPGQPYIPGLAPPQEGKTAAKNKARKEKKKAAAAASKASEGEESSTAGGAAGGGGSSGNGQAARPPTPEPEAAQQDPEKKAKALQKKLKQIDELKKRAAGGEKLNEDQKGKLSSEDDLRKQLAALCL